MADIDGDGRPDLLTTNNSNNTFFSFSVIRNAGSYCAPTTGTFTVAACGSLHLGSKKAIQFTQPVIIQILYI